MFNDSPVLDIQCQSLRTCITTGKKTIKTLLTLQFLSLYNTIQYTIKLNLLIFQVVSRSTIHASQIANSTLPTVHFRIWLSQSLANSLEMRQYPQRVRKCNAYHWASSDYSLHQRKGPTALQQNEQGENHFMKSSLQPETGNSGTNRGGGLLISIF